MVAKGRLSSVSRDYMSGNVQLTFTVEGKPDITELENIDLRIEAKKWHERRSLDANAYLWVLCSKIAEKGILGASRQEVYETMLKRYGTIAEDADGNHVVITIPSKTDINAVDGHWLPYKQSPDGKFSSYIMIFGSSLYNTKEMSVLLDGVVSEAKELGVDTMTPDEIERLKSLWNQ